MADTLTGVCFHHGKVTVSLPSTAGVNMDECADDFLPDFRDAGMGAGRDVQNINTRQTIDSGYHSSFSSLPASQHTDELYKDMHFTNMKTGSRNLEACL